MHPQLPLPLGVVPATSFDTFTIGELNRVAAVSVELFARGEQDEQQLFIWGDVGTGKSHLLSAACQTASELGYRVAYLPGELANQHEALLGLEHCDLVCVDDLQRLDHAAEEDLFHCINRCREQSARLLFAADRQANQLGLLLPDLQTRLGWGPVYHLNMLDDDELQKALRHELQTRALSVSDEVLAYLLRRYPRDMMSLKRVVNRLDEASLSEQRRITIPLIRNVLGDDSVSV